MLKFLFVFCSLCLLATAPAHAYIGPGGGLTAIGAIVAVIAVIIVIFFGFLWYPIKRLRKKWQARKADKS